MGQKIRGGYNPPLIDSTPYLCKGVWWLFVVERGEDSHKSCAVWVGVLIVFPKVVDAAFGDEPSGAAKAARIAETLAVGLFDVAVQHIDG